MKLERFLTWIQEKLLNYPDISFTTVKMFIQGFHKCLSSKEKERWITQIQMINELTLKQITIDSFVKDTIINNLENEIDDLKNADNELNRLK